MSKRRLTEKQKRQIAQNQDQTLDTESALQGIVITHYGKQVVVEDGDTKHTCKLRQNLGDIACGDRVAYMPEQENEHGVVLAIHQRDNLLEKTGFAGKAKPVAANIDQVVIVCAVSPEPNPYLIDRYIVATENLPAKPILVINKIDMLDAGNQHIADDLQRTYEQLDITTIETSAKRDIGIEELRKQLDDHTSILVGLSGVGKSSLVNCIIPEVDARVGEVSTASMEGTHTTTVSTLYHLSSGGHLIDSPGVRDFTPIIDNRQQVLNGFSELSRHIGECKFNDCAHHSEPGCAIRKAIEQEEISPMRLQSYQHMLSDLEIS